VNDRKSLENLSGWIARARKPAEATVKVSVTGNECDVIVGKTVDAEGLMEHVSSIGAVLGLEVSAVICQSGFAD
jgi:hypothetical protein